ncbi:hypothetical protein K1719_009354 [Acacia pycnantha]|nr:hypothetical protein K1719_009354 [Acacia pycnantha]
MFVASVVTGMELYHFMKIESRVIALTPYLPSWQLRCQRQCFRPRLWFCQWWVPDSPVASYKVCWPPKNGSECFDADILGGFDVTIDNGVDVISVSLGRTNSKLFSDYVALGSFHVAKRGIAVVCSAVNSGPDDATIENLTPWFLTVAASTMDRQFPAYVTLGHNLTFKVHSTLTYRCYIFSLQSFQFKGH